MKPVEWTVIATQVPVSGNLGGVVRYTTELIRALAQRDDVRVTALTTRAAAESVAQLLGGDVRIERSPMRTAHPDDVSGARINTVPGGPVPLLSIAERLAPLPGLRRGPDVVHGIKHLVPRRSTALRVLTVHDMLLLDRSEDFPLAKRVLLPRFYRASIRDADLLLCVSEATKARLEAQVPGAGQRSAVVGLATSQSLRTVAARLIPELAGRRFALVVGDSSPRKNLQTVIAAWAQVQEAVPGAVLAIAGPPSWGATVLGTKYDDLVASGAVVALGYVDDAGLRWSYENASVVLCPSLAEGFGLPAAEALGFGAPVLISEDAALQEVAAGRARAVLPALDAGAWAAAISTALRAPEDAAQNDKAAGASSQVVPARTWAEVAEDTVTAVQQRLLQRKQTADAR